MTEVMEGGNSVPTSDKTVADGLHARIDGLVRSIGSSEIAAAIADVSEASVARWRKGPTMPPFDKLAALCLAADVSVNWLATGEGPRSIRAATALPELRTHQEHEGGRFMEVLDRTREVLDPTQLDAGMVLVPRLSLEGSAGTGLIPTDEDVDGYVAFSLAYLRKIDVSPRHAHLLRLRGQSMYPTLMDRDLVIIDTSKNAVLGEAIFALVFGEAVLIKRVQPLRDGSLRIASDNKAEGYIDEIVPPSERDQLRIIGRVGGYLRDFWG